VPLPGRFDPAAPREGKGMSDGSKEPDPQSNTPAPPPSQAAGDRLGSIALVMVVAATALLAVAMVIVHLLFAAELDAVRRGQVRMAEMLARLQHDGAAVAGQILVAALTAAGVLLAAAGTASGLWSMTRGRRARSAIAVLIGGTFLLCLLVAWLMLLAGRQA
jgi:hypothetical protein